MNSENSIINYAPVIIPTLCRFDHFTRCIESLSLCEGASETDLYISVDYPKSEKHQDGYNKIVAYLDAGIWGFKSVHVYKQQNNLGAVNNWMFLYDVIKKDYNCYIGTEDDNTFSPNFLLFVNIALEKYKCIKNVFSVSGYGYPLNDLNYIDSYYLYPAYSAWGVGVWIDKYENVKEIINNKDYGKSVLTSFKSSYKLLKKNPHILSELLNMVSDDAFYGDTVYETFQVLEGYQSVFPTISKTRNHGHDGSGEHCSNCERDIYKEQEIDKSKIVSFEIGPGFEYFEFAGIMNQYKMMSRKRIIKTLIKYILYRSHLLSLLR